MEKDKSIRPIVNDVLWYACYKEKIIRKQIKSKVTIAGAMTNILVTNLCTLVWMEVNVAAHRWRTFLDRHFEIMMSSPKLYAQYVSYACYLLKEESSDIYKSFLNTLGFMAQAAIYCCRKGRKEFLNATIDMYCIFFDREIYHNFLIRGGWKKLNKYLESQENAPLCKEVKKGKDASQSEILQYVSPECLNDSINNFAIKKITRKIVGSHKPSATFAEEMATRIKESLKEPLPEEFIEEPEGAVGGEPEPGSSLETEDAYPETKTLAVKKAVALLEGVSKDILALYELILFVFEECIRVGEN
ncbi:uncharacterized protein CDAR_41881 [Caerostris darwini]|uniref:Uncharacterized protein n=2 Tax=Caerostris darwini TaxID=1538125 RepID=A0AAV4V2D5_9ARAC|nr:uncharacterized protein CDAR_41881 [Caerostris darwini]